MGVSSSNSCHTRCLKGDSCPANQFALTLLPGRYAYAGYCQTMIALVIVLGDHPCNPLFKKLGGCDVER